jgi:uncharacterized membrane protein YheB (UPF0754 family)
LSSVEKIYNAEISAGSLLLKESREIAKLLVAHADEAAWHKALVIDNVLQKKSPASARRMARLIRNRLEAMNEAHWQLVLDNDREASLQALLAAAINHSRLLEDFLSMVIKEHYRTFKRQMTLGDWRTFLDECENRETTAASWSDSTKKKLGQVIIRIFAEAGYLENTRNMQLSPIQIHPKVREYLQGHEMDNILRCMEIDR